MIKACSCRLSLLCTLAPPPPYFKKLLNALHQGGVTRPLPPSHFHIVIYYAHSPILLYHSCKAASSTSKVNQMLVFTTLVFSIA